MISSFLVARKCSFVQISASVYSISGLAVATFSLQTGQSVARLVSVLNVHQQLLLAGIGQVSNTDIVG